MKKHIPGVILACLTGIGIGIPVTLLCMYLLGGWHPILRELIVWTVASALFGLLTYCAFQFFEDLSLPVFTALHCAGCLSIVVFAGLVCGYADSLGELLRGILPVFLLVYTAVYGLCYLGMKAEAKRINKDLEK